MTSQKKHIMKQAAVAALFTTEETRKRYREMGVDFQNLSEDETRRLIEAAKQGHKAGSTFAQHVIAKVYENVKWSGLYYDPDVADKGIEPSKVTKENAEEIMSLTARAFEALMDDGNIYIARYMFPLVVKDAEVDWGQSPQK